MVKYSKSVMISKKYWITYVIFSCIIFQSLSQVSSNSPSTNSQNSVAKEKGNVKDIRYQQNQVKTNKHGSGSVVKENDGVLLKLQEALKKLKPEVGGKSSSDLPSTSFNRRPEKLKQDTGTKHQQETEKKLENNDDTTSSYINNDGKLSKKSKNFEEHSKNVTSHDVEEINNNVTGTEFTPFPNSSFLNVSADSHLIVQPPERDELNLINGTLNVKSNSESLFESTSAQEQSHTITSSSKNEDVVSDVPTSDKPNGFVLFKPTQESISAVTEVELNQTLKSERIGLTTAPTYHSVFLGSPTVCTSKFSTKNGSLGLKDKESEVTTPNSILERTQDDNASAEILLKKLDEKDQLETYSQFAERVSAENKNEASVISSHHSTNGQTTKGSKVKSKNYASPDCGSKLNTANNEASHSSKIIQTDKDEYMLNKCSDKIWAVVELCEIIRPQKFDIANFELFSNQPKDIKLYGSNRFPTRKWAELGTYEGAEGNREIQSFDIETEEFFKFIKFEVSSSYGTEYYCPISLFRIYGLTEMEVIDQLEEPEEIVNEEDPIEDEKPTKEKVGILPNMIKSVFSGMMDVIKRGSVSNSTNSSQPEMNSLYSLSNSFVVSNNSCFISESLNYILSCYYDEYQKLLLHPFIAGTVRISYFCHELSNISCSNPDINDSIVYDTICNSSYACVMLSSKHMLAMCHIHDPKVIGDLLECANLSQHDNSSRISPPPRHGEAAGDKHISADAEYSKIQGSGDLPLDANVIPRPASTGSGDNVHHSGGEGKKTESEATSMQQKKKKEKTVASARAPNATLPQQDKRTNGTRKETKDGAEETPEEVPSTVDRIAAPSANKEPIVVRLSNKIKVLEQNMSISSQYLEELSRRYKRQMEDMQEQFNITIRALNRTSQTAVERDVQHQKRIEKLETKLEKLTDAVGNLAEQQEILLTKVFEYHLILFVVEIIMLCFMFLFCLRTRKAFVPVVRANGCIKNANNPNRPIRRVSPISVRRMSLNCIEKEDTPTKRRRRLSSEMEVAGPYEDLLVTEEKRKKRSALKRSTSSHALKNRSQSSGRPEKNLDMPKRASVAGVLFSHQMKGGSTTVEELETDWRVVRKGKKQRPHCTVQGFSVPPDGSPPTLNYDGPIISDYYSATNHEVEVNDIPQMATELASTTTPIWSATGTFTKTSTLPPELSLAPLASTNENVGAATPLDYGWVNPDMELFPPHPREAAVKFKLPQKSRKKKKSKTSRETQ